MSWLSIIRSLIILRPSSDNERSFMSASSYLDFALHNSRFVDSFLWERVVSWLCKIPFLISQAEESYTISTAATGTSSIKTSALYSSASRGSTKGRELPPRCNGGYRGCEIDRGEFHHCSHCQRTNHSVDCWWELQGKPTWASNSPYAYMVDSTRSPSILPSSPAPQTTSTGFTTADGSGLSRVEYNTLLKKMQSITISDVATLAHQVSLI